MSDEKEKLEPGEKIRMTDTDMLVSGATSLHEINIAMRDRNLLMACGATNDKDANAFLIVRGPLVPAIIHFAADLERQWHAMAAPPKVGGNDGSPNIKLN